LGLEERSRIAKEFGIDRRVIRPVENVEYLMQPEVKELVGQKLFDEMWAKQGAWN
jgi:hypothetical protein